MPFCSRMKLKSWLTPRAANFYQQFAHLANTHPHGRHLFHPLGIEGRIADYGSHHGGAV